MPLIVATDSFSPTKVFVKSADAASGSPSMCTPSSPKVFVSTAAALIVPSPLSVTVTVAM